jgi:hypothetical protein
LGEPKRKGWSSLAKHNDKVVAQCQGCTRANQINGKCWLLYDPGWHWRGERQCSFWSDDPYWQEDAKEAGQYYRELKQFAEGAGR